MDIVTSLREAARRRQLADLPNASTTVYRLLSGAGDGLPGLYIEALGSTAFVRLRSPEWMQLKWVSPLAEALRDHGFQSMYLSCDEIEKHRPRQALDNETDLNAAVAALGMEAPQGRFTVLEQGRQFSVCVRDGYSWGLFTDMRTIRSDLAARWRKRRILNLFAYTCGFGVYLARHNQVTNVDVSRKYLGIGADNYELNQLTVEPGCIVVNDAFSELSRARRQARMYDAIVLDPPAFSRGKAGRSRRFSVRDDLPELVRNAAAVLAPGGELFVSTNLEALSAERFQAIVLKAAREARDDIRFLRSWRPQPDFPCAGPYHLKTALLGNS